MAKKYFKKALSMTLALTLCLSLTAPAFAEEGEPEQPQGPTVEELVQAANEAQRDASEAQGAGDTANGNTTNAVNSANDAATNAGSAEGKANGLNDKTTDIAAAATDAKEGIEGISSETITGAVSGMNGVVERIETKTNETIDELNTNTENTVNGKDEEIAAAGTEIDKISENVNTQLGAAKEALETAKAEGATEADKQNAIDAAQNAVEAAEAAKGLVKAEVEKAEAAKNAAAKAVKQAKEDYDALVEAANQAITTGTKEYQDAIQSAQSKLTAAQVELNNAAQAKAEAEQMVNDLESMVTEAKKQEAEAAKTNANTAKTNAQEAYGKAAAAETKAQNTINQIGTKLSELGTEKSAVESTKGDKETALGTARTDKENAQKVLDETLEGKSLNQLESEKTQADKTANQKKENRDSKDKLFISGHVRFHDLPANKERRDTYNTLMGNFNNAKNDTDRRAALTAFETFLSKEANAQGLEFKDLLKSMNAEADAKQAAEEAAAKVQQHKDATKTIEKKTQEINSLTTAINDLDRQISSLATDIGKLNAAKAVAEGAKSTAAATKTQAANDMTAAETAAQNAAEAIGKLNAAKEKLEAARQAQEAYQAAQDKVTQLQTALNEALKNQKAPTYTELQQQKELEADLNVAIAEASQAERDANMAKEEAEKALEEANAIVIPGPGDTGDLDDSGVTIDDQVIPLASGPVTRAQFIDYLWRHEGSPAVEGELFADHEYAPAIAWALSFELIDETFQPDELVTVADVRAILGSFAQVFGTNAVSVADLTTLTGGDGEAVMNCDQVLAEFFGEEYLLPEDLDSLETDDAA